ncbi:MAG TPA: hypothetical protein VJW77_01500 [Terriglobia bacterium]|nr:hypothetical protein [Terriglobia bacterium]
MRRFAVVSALCILALGVTLFGQEKTGSSPIVGTWTCVAHGGENGDVPFTLSLEQSSDGYTGSVSAPQGDADLSSVTFADNQLKITIDADEHNYALNATLDSGKLAGEWLVDGQKKGAWEGKK